MRFSPPAALALALTLAGCMGTVAPTPAPPEPPAPKLHVEGFGQATSAHTLIVVLHAGEAARIEAAYSFARGAAAAIPNSAAVALLRPGFSDARGKASPGEPGLGTGDNYTQPVLDVVAETIATLRRRYPQAHVILVGDRGGAAIAADIAALKPGLADGVVLVSCPCALPEWRAYMAARDAARPWKAPVTSLDPLRSAGGVQPGLKAAILVGADDKNTPVRFSRSYAEALALRGIDIDYRILPGKGEAILGEPDVLAATQRMAQALDGNH